MKRHVLFALCALQAFVFCRLSLISMKDRCSNNLIVSCPSKTAHKIIHSKMALQKLHLWGANSSLLFNLQKLVCSLLWNLIDFLIKVDNVQPNEAHSLEWVEIILGKRIPILSLILCFNSRQMSCAQCGSYAFGLHQYGERLACKFNQWIHKSCYKCCSKLWEAVRSSSVFERACFGITFVRCPKFCGQSWRWIPQNLAEVCWINID